MKIIDKLRNREAFTPTENAIATYLRENSREATNLSLNELSDALHASKSSIIRFCKKLGFKGHKELSVELAKELDAFTYNNRQFDRSVPFTVEDDFKSIAEKTYTLLSSALTDTWEDLDVDNLYRISKMMHERKNIFVYAGEDGYFLAKDFMNKLGSIGYPVYFKSSPGTNVQMASIQDNKSVAFFIYYDQYTEELVKVAQILNNRNIPIVTLTGPEKGPITKYATESLTVSYFEPSPKVVGLGSFTAMQLVLNIIYANLFCMDYEKNITLINTYDENRRKVYGEKE